MQNESTEEKLKRLGFRTARGHISGLLFVVAQNKMEEAKLSQMGATNSVDNLWVFTREEY